MAEAYPSNPSDSEKEWQVGRIELPEQDKDQDESEDADPEVLEFLNKIPDPADINALAAWIGERGLEGVVDAHENYLATHHFEGFLEKLCRAIAGKLHKPYIEPQIDIRTTYKDDGYGEGTDFSRISFMNMEIAQYSSFSDGYAGSLDGTNPAMIKAALELYIRQLYV